MSLTLPQLLALKLQAQGQQPNQTWQNTNGQNAQQQMMNQNSIEEQAIQRALGQAIPQGQYGGIAGAGNSIADALALQNLQAQNSPAAQAMVARGQVSDPSQAASVLNPSPFSQAGNWLSNLFGFGGGSGQ